MGGRPVVSFALVSAALIGVLALVLGVVFSGNGLRRAIALSAGVAFAVQLVAFALLRRLRGSRVMLAWGLGAVLRFLVLVAYALVAGRVFGFAATVALMSLVSFFFVSMLAEPWLLRS